MDLVVGSWRIRTPLVVGRLLMDSPNREQPSLPPPMLITMDAGIQYTHREIGSRTQVIAHHIATGKFFHLGAEEFRIASLLDGARGMTEVVEQLHREGILWEPTDVAELIKRFVACGIAITSTGPATAPPAPDSTRKPAKHWQQRMAQSLSMVISQRIPLMQGDAIASWFEARIGGVFSVNGICLWCVLVASGLTVVSGHQKAFGDEVRRMFDSGMWMMLLVIWIVSKIVHELGHAVAARYHGVRVGKIGIMFFLFAPMAYVDVTDAWRLRSRWNRVQIATGGVYFELACAALAAWAWWFLPQGMAKHLAAQFFLISGPATLLVNANPLLRLDGYYVLGDLIEIPNLRMHGRQQCVSWIEYFLFGIPRQRPLLAGWRRIFASAHAIASVVFQIMWMSGLVIGVSMWARGLGVAIAVVAVALWVVLPLVKWIAKVWMYQADEKRLFTKQRYRLIAATALIATTLPSISIMTSPLDRRVPVVVQFRDEHVARAATEAFVTRVHVEAGQRVRKGAVLIELTNPELLIRREQKADALKLAELKAIQLRRNDELSKSSGESDTAASLARQLDELDQQIAALRIVAQRDGFVIGHQLDSLEGRFVKQGEELLRVCDPQEKELLAAVGPTDVESYQSATKASVTSHVRLRGGKSFIASPASLRPRARVTLPHPAMSATVGGPLPVEPSPNEGEAWRTVDPQMESVTSLDPITSLEIHAGQLGTMTIHDNRTFVARLWEAMK